MTDIRISHVFVNREGSRPSFIVDAIWQLHLRTEPRRWLKVHRVYRRSGDPKSIAIPITVIADVGVSDSIKTIIAWPLGGMLDHLYTMPPDLQQAVYGAMNTMPWPPTQRDRNTVRCIFTAAVDEMNRRLAK